MNEPTYNYNDFLMPALADGQPDISIEISEITKKQWNQLIGIHEVVVYKDCR